MNRHAWTGWIALLALSAGAASGCGPDVNTLLERASDSRRIAADLRLQFTKAADAANRAVMADTDEASVAFAHEDEQATQAVQRDIDALRPILEGLRYTDETRLLTEFVGRFATYQALDRRILDLAVENTNLKAQRLSFGPGQETADAFRDALEALVPLTAEKDRWHVEALIAKAETTVREIQVLQAPHIANADEAVMTRMESRMASSEARARGALGTLTTLVQPAARPRLAAATAALDRFMGLNAQIIELSRRNTNVRSLALSLDEKRTAIASCEESLQALQDALAKRGVKGTR